MRETLLSLYRLWFTFTPTVGRRAYAQTGLALAAVKFTGDWLLVWTTTGRYWSPLGYLGRAGPITEMVEHGPPFLWPILAVWSLPFMWIGVSMTMRRALDSGRSAWLGLWFFAPVLNYFVMAVLCFARTETTTPDARSSERILGHQLPRVLPAVLAGAMIAAVMLTLSVVILESYGTALFFGTPFLMGAVAAYLYNARGPASMRETQQVMVLTFTVVAGVLALTAVEGILCLAMAAPLALLIGAMGAGLGRHIALHDHRGPQHAWIGVLLLPLSAAVDRPAALGVGPLREVRSSVDIRATPMHVWRDVIAFPELPAPTALLFRAGIAYPTRAEIRGAGVGAIRYCVFSTGAFVEPITQWQPGRRLSFDVASQPRALSELSPYANITPPHLDGYFMSRRGEFRLIALPNGWTRLEGSTWYEMRLAPTAYWAVIGDLIIHRIHGRVLTHIKSTVEQRLE